MINKQLVADSEILKEVFLILFYNKEADEWHEFECSRYKNDLYALVSFYNTDNIECFIGYNNLGFDSQVMEFILENHQKWYELDGEGVAGRIYKFVQALLEDRKYGVRLPYFFHSVPQIDCFTILGLDNEARLTSLKALEFALDMKSVETMPIHHSSTNLSESEIELIKNYCKTDIISTSIVFDLIKGDTNHPVHKGKNLLDLRESIKKEFGLECTNFSDIKIGDELMKLSYAKAIKKTVSDLPKKGTFRKYVKLADCLPSFISFKSQTLQSLLEKLKKTTLKSGDEWEETFKFGNTKYIQGLGGLHSVNENETYKNSDTISIVTADVALTYRRN